jgi:acetyl-CoA carboxylase biotin carboxylase subunit
MPVVPGSKGSVDSVADALAIGEEFGYPVIVKATAGGGGRGMQLVRNPDEMEVNWKTARTEALAAFGNADVYIEKFLTKPRHIEIQVLCDTHGNAVHVGERDCSLQRRNQKVLEEAPSPALNEAQRKEIGETVADAMRKMKYRGVGTVEFLYEDGEFFFIEMNTRLQVEHPISEMISGLDLAREQIRVASGAPLGYTQDDIKFQGHSIECRINAEDPENFMPCPGKITDYHAPGGLSVRVDSALYSGYSVPPHYDSMIAKLIVHGNNRNECLMRLRRALGEYVIGGIKTSIPLHQKLLENPDFINGDYDIKWLEKFVGLTD